jgi:hypothetical protein
MDTPPSSDDRATRRRLLGLAGGTLFATAGCLGNVVPGDRPTGTLRVRVRNTSSSDRRVTVRIVVDDSTAFEGSVRLDAPGEAPYTEQVWDAVEDLPDETPYRVVVEVDGERYAAEDVANCIADEGTVRGFEWVHVSVRDDETKILTDDCPA